MSLLNPLQEPPKKRRFGPGKLAAVSACIGIIGFGLCASSTGIMSPNPPWRVSAGTFAFFAGAVGIFVAAIWAIGAKLSR